MALSNTCKSHVATAKVPHTIHHDYCHKLMNFEDIDELTWIHKTNMGTRSMPRASTALTNKSLSSVNCWKLGD